MLKHTAILGAGGHAKVLAYVLGLTGFQIVGFTDDNPSLQGTKILGYPVVGSNERIPELAIEGAIVGIGDNRWREVWYRRLLAWGVPAVNAIHPSVVLAQGVVLGQGVAVLANASVNVDASIGSNVILNTASVVGHDCHVGDHAHVGPGVLLCGSVRIGRGACLGAGATVIPNCVVGEGSIVGAGTVVLEDVPDHVVVVGNPGRIIRRADERVPLA